MNVFDLKMGEVAKIRRIDLTGSALERLLSLGLAVGETVEVLSYSLFKGSVLISCNAVRVGVRKSLAKKIEVEV
ncbi:MAG: ferrous iron transport protein A [Clostridia bacterium]|nr:ferrous iron transport protein A [Clostridia bacterium]